jgi:hypothetical protein
MSEATSDRFLSASIAANHRWEGDWYPGELRMQRQDAAGQWLCQVQYRRPGELSNHIDTFPASEVRADTVDRSASVDNASATPPT